MTTLSPNMVGSTLTRRSMGWLLTLSSMRPSCGHAAFGDVEVGHDLDAAADGGGDVGGRGHHFVEHAVDAVAHLEFAFERLEVNVGSLVLDGLEEDEVDELADGVGIGGFLEAVDVDGFAAVFEVFEGVVGLELAEDFADAFGGGLVILGDEPVEDLGIGSDFGGDLVPIRERRSSRARKFSWEAIATVRALVAGSKEMGSTLLVVASCAGTAAMAAGSILIAFKVDDLKSLLGGQSDVEVAFLDGGHVDEDSAELDAGFVFWKLRASVYCSRVTLPIFWRMRPRGRPFSSEMGGIPGADWPPPGVGPGGFAPGGFPPGGGLPPAGGVMGGAMGGLPLPLPLA